MTHVFFHPHSSLLHSLHFYSVERSITKYTSCAYQTEDNYALKGRVFFFAKLRGELQNIKYDKLVKSILEKSKFYTKCIANK